MDLKMREYYTLKYSAQNFTITTLEMVRKLSGLDISFVTGKDDGDLEATAERLVKEKT